MAAIVSTAIDALGAHLAAVLALLIPAALLTIGFIAGYAVRARKARRRIFWR